MFEKNKKTPILIWSNQENIISRYSEIDDSEIYFKKYKKNDFSHYLIICLNSDSQFGTYSTDLFDVINESTEKNKKILFILNEYSRNIKSSEDSFLKFINNLSSLKIHSNLLVVRDLYSFPSKKIFSQFDDLVDTSINTSEIKINIKGQNNFYPTSLESIVPAVKKILFLNITNTTNYRLYGKQISDSNLGYLLKKIYEEKFKDDFNLNVSKINHIDQPTTTQQYESQTSLNIQVSDTFENDLKKYVTQKEEKKESNVFSSDNSKKTKVNSIIEKIKKIYKKNKKREDLNKWAINKIKKTVNKLFFLIVFVFTLSSFIYISSSYYTLKLLSSSLFYIQKGDITMASNKLKNSKLSLEIAKSNYQLILPAINFVNNKLSDQALNFTQFLDISSDSLDSIIQSFVLVEKVYQSFNSPSSIDYENTTLAIKSNLQQNYESLSQIELILNGLKLPFPVIENIKKNNQYEEIIKAKESIWEISKIVDLIPYMVGYKKNTNIILLVQNNHELRATGGVIDSLYHLSMDNGRVVFVKRYTPSEIDKINETNLDSPPLIEKVTGEKKWLLKDMNYNPDFFQTSVNISWYIEDKLKTKPDFIIGINTDLLTDLISDQKVASSLNIGADKSQYLAHLEMGMAAKETQQILDTGIDSFFQHKIPLVNLFNIFAENIDQLRVWSSDSEIQSLIYSQDISGTVNKQKCLPAIASSRKCHQETIYLNLSNFSSIPLNNYLKRDLKIISTPQSLNVDNQIKLETSYKKPTILINRNLTEIVQIYLNNDSIFKKATVDGNEVPIEEVITQSENGLNRYQFNISTPLNKNSELIIEYTTPLKERAVLPMAYSYSIIPQPGQKYNQKTLEVNVPESARISTVTSKVDTSPNKITVNLQDKGSFGYNLVPR